MSLLPERIVFLGNKPRNCMDKMVVLPIDLAIIIILASPKQESTSSRSIKINCQEISSIKNKHIAARPSSISFNSTQNQSKAIFLIKKPSLRDSIILLKRHLSSASSKNNLNKLNIFRTPPANSIIVNSKQEMTPREMHSQFNPPVNSQLPQKMEKIKFLICSPQPMMNNWQILSSLLKQKTSNCLPVKKSYQKQETLNFVSTYKNILLSAKKMYRTGRRLNHQKLAIWVCHSQLMITSIWHFSTLSQLASHPSTGIITLELILIIFFTKHHPQTYEILSFILQTWRVLFSSVDANNYFSGPQDRSVTFVRCPEWINYVRWYLLISNSQLFLSYLDWVDQDPKTQFFYHLTQKQIACFAQGSRTHNWQHHYVQQKYEPWIKKDKLFCWDFLCPRSIRLHLTLLKVKDEDSSCWSLENKPHLHELFW